MENVLKKKWLWIKGTISKLSVLLDSILSCCHKNSYFFLRKLPTYAYREYSLIKRNLRHPTGLVDRIILVCSTRAFRVWSPKEKYFSKFSNIYKKIFTMFPDDMSTLFSIRFHNICIVS